MRILLLAATALTLTGSALAYQTEDTMIDPAAAPTVTVDPTVAINPPATWTNEQRTLWEQHMAALPASWTAEERAAFQAMMPVPPVNWTAEQRALYETHMASLPSSWTPEQRAAYEQQIADLRSPWLGAQQTASAEPTMTTTSTTTVAPTYAAAQPISSQIIQPSNADPEHDARGIAVISDPAVVPDGYNGFAGTGMGGPLVDPATGESVQGANASYPACSATVTDNCIQLYERGVRAQLANWDRPTGGHAEGASTTAATGGPYEPVDSSTAATSPTHGDHMGDTSSTTTQPDPAGTTEDDTTGPDTY